MKLLRVSKDFPKDTTGNIYNIQFTLGYALVDIQYDYNWLIEKGFEDVTPKWMENIKVNLDASGSEVLVIRWGGFGDNLLVEPAMRAIKEKYHNTKITFAGRSPQNSILLGNPVVSSWYQGMKHKIAHYVGQYDDVYDFTHSIECNPNSEWRDAKEIACEFVGLKPYIAQIRPRLFLFKEEFTTAVKILESKGIDVERDKIIGIHVEASSFIRTFHPSFTIKLANKLAAKGYKVLLLGQAYADIINLKYMKCPRCKREIGAKTSKTSFMVTCRKCNKKFKYTDNPNIINLVGKVPNIRHVAAMFKFFKLLIAPDSGFVHIAQAVGTKTLAIYWSFDAATRCKYYKNIYVYQRPFRCAPCHQHGSKCSRWPGKDGFPPCTMIKVKEVLPIINKLLKGKLGDYVPTGIIPNFIQKCPMCFGKPHKLMCRKGNYFYFKCLTCGTIHIDRKPNVPYTDKNYYSEIYNTVGYKKGQQMLAQNILIQYKDTKFDSLPRILEIGCGMGDFLGVFRKAGWNELGIELNPNARKVTNKLKLNTTGESFESPKCKLKKNWYDLIVAIQTIEHFMDLEAALIKMRNCLYEKGRIFITCPDGSGYKDNRYGHINTYYAGEHIILPTIEGLRIICNRLGLKIQDIRTMHNSISAWIVKK